MAPTRAARGLREPSRRIRQTTDCVEMEAVFAALPPLHHHDKDQLLLGVDREKCAPAPLPVEAADRARNQTEIRMGANGEAEPPARTQGGADFVSRDVDVRRQRICRHQPDSFRLQAGTRSGTVGTITSSDSSGLAVAQTLLAAIMRYRAVVLRLRWPRFVEIAQSGRRNTRVKPAPLTQERSRVKRTVSSSILCTALCRRSPFLRRVRDLETVLAVFLPIVPACLLHLHY